MPMNGINSKTRSSFLFVLVLIYLNVMKINNSKYHTNKGKSSLTSLVACFTLGKVYCKTGLTENDMPVV
jgi:hypothetical protein